MYILYVLYLYEDKTFKKSIDERVRYFVDIYNNTDSFADTLISMLVRDYMGTKFFPKQEVLLSNPESTYSYR